MPWLVEAHLARSRHRKPRHPSVSLVRDRCDEFNPFSPQFLHAGLDVVTHEEDLVLTHLMTPTRPRMDRELAWRQGEDEPAVACVDTRKAEDVAEESARPLGVVGEDEGVGSGDHAAFVAHR